MVLCNFRNLSYTVLGVVGFYKFLLPYNRKISRKLLKFSQILSTTINIFRLYTIMKSNHPNNNIFQAYKVNSRPLTIMRKIKAS